MLDRLPCSPVLPLPALVMALRQTSITGLPGICGSNIEVGTHRPPGVSLKKNQLK